MTRLVCGCLAFAAATAAAETTPGAALLALSKRDHTLAIVDPRDMHVVARVGVGDDPHEVVASADGRIAYVSNYGFGALHTLTPIDLVAQKPLTPIDLGALRGPHGLVFEGGVATLDVSVSGANRLEFTPDGKRVLISAGTLVVMDAATRQVVRRIESVHATGGIQVQPDGARAYAACGRDGFVAAVDLKTLEMLGKVDVGGPDGLAWAEGR